MRAAEGAALVGTAWLTNQVIGYLVLGYPLAWDTAAWGILIGVASFAGLAAAGLVSRSNLSGAAGALLAFAAAFIAYEAVLYAATAVLPSDGTFSAPVIAKILLINAVAFAGLLLFYWSAVALHVLRPAPGPTAAAV
jgi:hypothetical protein